MHLLFLANLFPKAKLVLPNEVERGLPEQFDFALLNFSLELGSGRHNASMNQVVIQHFELKRVPQAVPGATEHPGHELPPQLTEGDFTLLADRAQDKLVGRGLVTSNQQQLGFLGQARGAFVAPLAQGAQEDAPVEGLDQGQRGLAILAVARRQDNIEYAPVKVAQEVAFEANEPALTGFAKVRPLSPQQSDPPVPDTVTEGNRLTVHKIPPRGGARMGRGRSQQTADGRQQSMHAVEPLLVRGQVRNGRPPIVSNQPIGLFEGGDLEAPLPQGQGQHCGITKLGLGVGRVPPLRPGRLLCQELSDKIVDLSHMVVYPGGHRASSSAGESKVALRFYIPLLD